MPIERVRTVDQRRHGPSEDAESLVQWLLDFERRELPTAPPAAARRRRGSNTAPSSLADRVKDLTAIAAEWDRLGDDLARFDQWRASRVLPEVILRDVAEGRTPKRRVPVRRLRPAEIRKIHQQLRALLSSLKPRDPDAVTEMPRPALPAQITRIHLGTSTDFSSIYRVYGAPWPDRFWLAVASLLETYGPRLRRCMAPQGKGRCGRLFLQKKREPHCSPKCSQRARARKWYEEHRDEASKRRQAAYDRAKIARPTRPTATSEV